MQVRKAYSDRRIDMLSRFPGLDWDDSFEAFYRYFQKQLEVDYDPASSITTLRVRAYDAQMAKQIDESMLEMGERLVNELNDRARADLVEVAEREVRTAENQVRESSAALGNLRRETRVFEPNRQSEMQLETVSRLEGELLAAQGQLDQLRRVSPSNPQIPALADRVRDLRRSAESERGKVVGGTRSYSSATSSFDRLLLDKTFAEKRLASAMEALEAARAEASRKQLYLERLAQPSLPDSSEEPRRLRGVVSVFLIGLAVWGVVTLVSATVREHVD
jgi:capsular polysaccharide transport system permease protein